MTLTNDYNTDSSPPTLKVFGRYSRAGEIEIMGDNQGLLELSQALVSKKTATEKLLLVPQNTIAYPYDGFLSAIRVNKIGEAVTITREDEVLNISGAPDKLELMAENIRSLAITESSDTTDGHLHIEYYP